MLVGFLVSSFFVYGFQPWNVSGDGTRKAASSASSAHRAQAGGKLTFVARGMHVYTMSTWTWNSHGDVC